MFGKMIWTEERVKKMVRLKQDGQSAEAIGRIMNCSRAAVLGKLHRLGVSSDNLYAANDVIRARKNRVNFVEQVSDDPPENAVHLRDIKEGQCRWPYGDKETGFVFCGHSVADGSSYCEGHKQKAIKRRKYAEN